MKRVIVIVALALPLFTSVAAEAQAATEAEQMEKFSDNLENWLSEAATLCGEWDGLQGKAAVRAPELGTGYKHKPGICYPAAVRHIRDEVAARRTKLTTGTMPHVPMPIELLGDSSSSGSADALEANLQNLKTDIATFRDAIR